MNAIMKTYEDGQLVYLSPNEITVIDGFNPRTYFDPKAAEALEDSIRAEGIQQNLVVRPDPEQPGRYLLIAGERRWRAARKLGLTEVPCLVRHVDARQALAIAALENEKRQNISPAEEAQQAQRVLDACDGDREEACRLLGWSRSRLDARLLLLHAHPDVLQALAEGRIKLGIAELLSGLPKVAQEKNLPIIIEKAYSVAELRQRLESMAQQLGTAIFDISGCRGCPHNTTTQASLFDDGMNEGQCVGRSCFTEKTQAALKMRQQELDDQYNAVFLDIEKPAGSWVYVLPDGEAGVGSAQAEACKGCANYGALLRSEPGCEGQVIESVCFDPVCNAEKVKTHKAEQAAATQAANEAGSPKTGQKAQAGKKRKGTASAPPKKIRELSIAFLREQAGQVSRSDPATRRALLLYMLLEKIGKLSWIDARELGPGIAILHAKPDDDLDALEVKACEALLKAYNGGQWQQATEIENGALSVLAVTKTPLSGRFVLTEDFLKAHTKAGIEALMREATNPDGEVFADWWAATKGPFKKLMGKKADEIVQAILESGFDFSTWVPTCIQGEVDKVISKQGN